MSSRRCWSGRLRSSRPHGVQLEQGSHGASRGAEYAPLLDRLGRFWVTRGRSIFVLCVSLILLGAQVAAPAAARAEETAADRELARRVASLGRRAEELTAAVEGIIKACGRCRGTGKFIHRGRQYGCPTCSGSGRIASKAMFKKARWEMMTPAFRSRPGASDLHDAEYWDMIKRQDLPYPIGTAIEPRLIDETHGTTILLVPRTGERVEIRWIYIEAGSRKNWYVYDTTVDGDWPVASSRPRLPEPAAPTQGSERDRPALQSRLADLDLNHEVRQVTQEDMRLYVDLGRLLAAQGGVTAEAATKSDVARALQCLSQTPPAQFTWEEVAIRFLRSGVDRFGAVVEAPHLIVRCDSTTLRRIVFDALTSEEVFQLLELDMPPRPGIRDVPAESQTLVEGLRKHMPTAGSLGVRFKEGALVVHFAASPDALAAGVAMPPLSKLVRSALQAVRDTPIGQDRFSTLDIQVLLPMVSKFGEVAERPALGIRISRAHLERIVFENVDAAQLAELLEVQEISHAEWKFR